MSDAELKYEYPLHVVDPKNLTTCQQAEVNKRQNEADRIKKMISKRDVLAAKLRVLDDDIRNEVARMNARREAYDLDVASKMRREDATLSLRKRKLMQMDNRLDNEADILEKRARALEDQNVRFIQPTTTPTSLAPTSPTIRMSMLTLQAIQSDEESN
ncbi:uncharacterized protein CELE_Y26D4A.21 [Caenorhabditis elegans]|uniref:Uncharacterized protein n=1 Tax=Caenorhabditis elegans TaxID=6239 RepID=B1V8J7_CAEEL|nr:Uncharacterized protein CELE_Y26D4A.21 [Caenorhabditis elegans]CAQ35063.2 Uncharacterized protein CELE_Y26D4A.21 [Caenorhabditis elegans]|eukprot:NP_001122536.2 Uncharacterized protein CELE_Y26D4A.21 [Caenorhabditis elegans]